ncbi:MAG: ATP-binding cassette domain-containing protein [Rickettsiales bacterium]
MYFNNIMNHRHYKTATSFIEMITWTPLVIAKDIAYTFSSLIGWKYLVTNSALQFGALYLFNNVIYDIAKQMNTKQADLDLKYNMLSSDNITSCALHSSNLWSSPDQCYATDDYWVNFQNSITAYAPTIFYHVGVSLIAYAVNDIFKTRLYRKVTDAVAAKIDANQTTLAFSHTNEDKQTISYIRNDAIETSLAGSRLLTNAITTLQHAYSSIWHLLRYSNYVGPYKLIPDLVAYSFLYATVTQGVTSLMSTKIKEYEIAAFKPYTELQLFESHSIANAKPSLQRGAEDFANARDVKLRAEIRVFSDKQRLLVAVSSAWRNLHSTLNEVFKYYVIGNMLFEQSIVFADRANVYMYFNDINRLFSWGEANSLDIKLIRVPLQRLNHFIAKEKQNREANQSLHFNQHNESTLEVQNLTLSVAGRNLVKIPSLTFEKGRRYLITGHSGNGKSSFLSKLHGIIPDGINASGTIVYPTTGVTGQPFKKYMLSQQGYIPPHSTILEVICLTANLPTANSDEYSQLLQRITNLLNEIKIDSELKDGESGVVGNLEVQHPNWEACLSGGQQKKLAVISAILQAPDLLILDEIFNGMDRPAIKNVQSMLMKYLPNAMMITVDHQGEENNKLNDVKFYQEHLHFSNRAVSQAQSMSL